MWLFSASVAKHRTQYNIVVKIESHKSSRVSGLREGRVMIDPSPMRHPIPYLTPPTVTVMYTDSAQEVFVEQVHVSTLRTSPRLKEKALHLIVKGERAGTLVIHLKTDGPMARVHAVDKHKSTAFYIEKEKVCLLERELFE